MSDRDVIIAHAKTGTLPALFIAHLRRHLGDELGQAFRATLTDLHNAGMIDVLEPARQIAISPIDQHQFFTVMQVYVDLIPGLEADAPAMIEAVKALNGRADEDMTSGRPYDAFKKWAEQGDRAHRTLAVIDPANPEDSVFLYLTLLALAKGAPADALTRAISYLEGPDGLARSAAAKAIGRFELVAPEGRSAAVAALADAAPTADDNNLAHILAAICEIARAHTEIVPQAAELIQTCVAKVGDNTIHQLSVELMLHGKELAPEIVVGLTAIMHKVPIENRATVDNIDASAGRLVEHKLVDEALGLITPLIEAHEELISMKAFGGTFFALLRLPPHHFAPLMMNWLLSENRNLGAAAKALVGAHHGDVPLVIEVGDTALDFDDSDRMLLAHRAIGWLFMYPITAASLLLGLLKGAGESATRAISDILFEPLLINYSGGLAQWLTDRAKIATDTERVVITDLLARLGAYIEGLRKAGRIKELLPSERERMIERQRQHRSMQEAVKAAEKRSAFMPFVSRSVLLYGNRSISYFKGPDGKTKRHEMKLGSFSHSFESPRLDILEPFDLDYMLRAFRAMRRTDL